MYRTTISPLIWVIAASTLLLLPSCVTSPPIPDPGPFDTSGYDGAGSNVAPGNHVQQCFVAELPSIEFIDVGLFTLNPGRGGENVAVSLLDAQGRHIVARSRYLEPGTDGWVRFPIGEIHLTPGELYRVEVSDTEKLAFGWKYRRNTEGKGGAVFYGTALLDSDYYLRVVYRTQRAD